MTDTIYAILGYRDPRIAIHNEMPGTGTHYLHHYYQRAIAELGIDEVTRHEFEDVWANKRFVFPSAEAAEAYMADHSDSVSGFVVGVSRDDLKDILMERFGPGTTFDV